jgi:gluconate 2-dehydrogenase gamma chain
MQDQTNSASGISRREAVRRTMFFLGGAISAPTLAGMLAGCERPRAEVAWQAQTLTGGRDELVATIAEYVIPTTDTPGARAAGVHEFIDVMLTEYYPEELREQFLAGLERLEARARSRHGVEFLRLDEEQQLALVTELNRLAFDDTAADEASPDGEPWDPQDVGREAFFRTMKELVVAGYYTSEIGATQELRLMPMGIYRADIPYDEVGRAWV